MGHPRDRCLAMSLPRVGQGQVAEYHPTEYPTSYICPEDLKATSSNNCYNPSSDDVASFLEDPQIDGPYSFPYYCDDDPQAIISPASGPSSPSRTPLAPHIIHGDVSSDSLSSSDIPQWHNYHLQDDFLLYIILITKTKPLSRSDLLSEWPFTGCLLRIIPRPFESCAETDSSNK
ncbi:hypothetical protein V502_09335 [Pseudogymnoascus sp. VKM F-4520 (FW-2644)]|nr:hypothetical protein V502_09335 [Pseudogymnoascus sp. VKM F-4520 (FW-2644)]